jgi:hypothetical protein
MDLTSDGTVSLASIRSICDKISEEIALNKDVIVYDRKELPFVLEHLDKKSSVPCSNTPCFSDLGKQLGADQIVGGSVKLTQGEFCIRLDRVDVKKNQVARTITEKMIVKKNDFISQKIHGIVQDLMAPQKPIASKTGKKGFFSHPATWITAATVAAAGVVVVVYMLPKKGNAGETDLPLNAPEHARQP